MKGLFCRAGENLLEPRFVLHETVLPELLENHEVRVEVRACGLSPLDLQLLSDVGINTDLVPVGRYVAGVVLQVGSQVTFFQPQDEVVGVLPLDSSHSGISDIIHIDEFHLVHRPEQLSPLVAAATLQDGLRAYTALHMLAGMAPGQTVLVMDGGSSQGVLCLQLASHHGLRVLTTAHCSEDQDFLEKLHPDGVRVVPVFNGVDLQSEVLEETGGLGVDIVVDSGVRLLDQDQDQDQLLPLKHDILGLLGVYGHWVTSHQDLQLDPPDCRLLHLKSASVSFLNPEVWTSSSSQQGRFLHILKDVVEKLSTGVLKPRPIKPIPVYEALVAMETVQHHPKTRTVIQL